MNDKHPLALFVGAEIGMPDGMPATVGDVHDDGTASIVRNGIVIATLQADGVLSTIKGGYEQQCAEAATAQGLDPVVAALTAANVPYTVEQTGGFCMVVAVALNDGTHIGVSAEPLSDSHGQYTAVLYAHEEDPEGATLCTDDDLSVVVLAICGALYGTSSGGMNYAPEAWCHLCDWHTWRRHSRAASELARLHLLAEHKITVPAS